MTRVVFLSFFLFFFLKNQTKFQLGWELTLLVDEVTPSQLPTDLIWNLA